MKCWSFAIPFILLWTCCYSQPLTGNGTATACGQVACLNGERCCAGQCYDSSKYMCFVQPRTLVEQLCPVGFQLCGEACYNRTEFVCNYNGEFYLEQGVPAVTGCKGANCRDQQCCALNSINSACFQETNSYCCNDPYIPQLNIVCGLNSRDRALSCCGPVYVQEDPNSNWVVPTVQCYDSDTQFCCKGCSPGGCVGKVCNLNDTVCCPPHP